ncbi:Proline-rich protein 5, partial [Frankliniella fusca]
MNTPFLHLSWAFFVSLLYQERRVHFVSMKLNANVTLCQMAETFISVFPFCTHQSHYISLLGNHLMFFAYSFQFAIVKFLSTDVDPSEYIDISLASWIIGDLDDNMKGKMYWPPKNVTNHVKFQHPFNPDWCKTDVQVLRFYETYAKARNSVKKFEDDSHYETEPEGIQTKRRRIQNKKYISDSSDDEPVHKLSTAVIPAPPMVVRNTSKTVKGLGLSTSELKKKEREEVMEKLKAARAKAASKLGSTSQRSPWKISALDETAPYKTMEDSSANAFNTESMNVLSSCSIQQGTTQHTTQSHHSPQRSNPSEHSPHRSNPSEHSPRSNPSQHSPPWSNLDTPQKLPSCHGTPRSDISFTYVSPNCTTLLNDTLSLHSQHSTPNCVHDNEQISSLPNRAEMLSKSDEKRILDYKSIPVNKSFSLSPKSARAVSLSLQKTQSSDGRRRLFSSEEDSIKDQLSSFKISLESLETISRKNAAKLDILLMNQSRIVKSMIPSERRITAPPNMPCLPLESKKALDMYESFLKESDVNLAAVCDYMSNFIRSSVVDPERASARSILTKLLSNNLAKEMNLQGGNNKIAFRSLHLYKVFLGTLQTAFPKSDLSAAEDALQKWLKDAKQRKQLPQPKSPRSKS